MNDIRQFKLASGEEIICEIMEWNNPEEDDLAVIRYPMTITYQSTINTEYDMPGASNIQRSAILTPWFLYQMFSDSVQTLNLGHTTAEAIPTTKVVDYYLSTIKHLMDDQESSEKDHDEMVRSLLNDETETEEAVSNVLSMFTSKKPTVH